MRRPTARADGTRAAPSLAARSTGRAPRPPMEGSKYTAGAADALLTVSVEVHARVTVQPRGKRSAFSSALRTLRWAPPGVAPAGFMNNSSYRSHGERRRPSPGVAPDPRDLRK